MHTPFPVDGPGERPLPFTVVLDHPSRHLGRRLWRHASDFLGGLLLVIGLTASIPAVPATVAVIGFVIGWAATGPAAPDPWIEALRAGPARAAPDAATFRLKPEATVSAEAGSHSERLKPEATVSS